MAVTFLGAGKENAPLYAALWLYPTDYVNAHDAEITEERKKAAGSAPPAEVSIGRIDALLAFDRRAGLPRIKTPTLVITSDNDYITPSYYAEALARAIPNAKLVVPHGGGHPISKTRPQEFNRIVLDFLEAAG